jgi:glutathionylspermidine synthase
MQRIACPERADWQTTAENAGFDFHTLDGARYWDERAYYAFSLDEIEQQIEGPTGELHAMCLELVERAMADETVLRRLKIPQACWPILTESWRRGDATLYGRFDFSFSGQGPVKLLEYNADTPTSLFEAAVFQWTWLEQAMERQIIPKGADQFNSIHDRLIARWRAIAPGGHLHLTGLYDNPEDAVTLNYLDDTAQQAGLQTASLEIESIGVDGDGQFVDLDDRRIDLAFKLYPWEWMLRDSFGGKVQAASTRWIEPPWKVVLSNKGILPLLWEMFPNHPNLLPAYFEDDANAGKLGGSYVRKPIYSREGANIELVSGGAALERQDGPYGSEGFVRQAFALLPTFDGQYPVIGSWIVGDHPCGLSIREDENPITGNTSRFLPHAIL